MCSEIIVTGDDAVRYIGKYVELHRENNDYFGICPFHLEDTPSFSVSTSSGLWYCFGCHLGGDLLSFIMRHHKVGFSSAKSIVQRFLGIDAVRETTIPLTRVLRSLQPHQKQKKEPRYTVLSDAIMARYVVAEDKLKVWMDEGISASVLAKYDVRYDPYDNRLVYPIRNQVGEIINIGARTLYNDIKEKKIRKYTYYYGMGLMDVVYGLYENRDGIQTSKEVIIFEGAKSVMLADTWGIHNAGAALTSRLNSEQVKVLLRLGVRVVIAFDAEVDPRQDRQIQLLARFLSVELVLNRNELLADKMAPVDRGYEVWRLLYEGREPFSVGASPSARLGVATG